MLLLRMTVGRWAPLCSILDPALWSVYRKAAFPSAFIRGAVGIEKVLAMASEVKKKSINIKPYRVELYLFVSNSTRKR